MSEHKPAWLLTRDDERLPPCHRDCPACAEEKARVPERVEFVSICIVHRRHGSDIVSIETNLPSATFPFDVPLDLSFHCAKGTARDYVAKYFPNAQVHEVSE